MYPPVVQFETKQIHLEAMLGVYGEREAAAQAMLAAASAAQTRPRPSALRRLRSRRPAVTRHVEA